MKEKIGFFGGCFNPPTIAHIKLAEEVIKKFKLNKVIFVPVNDYYEKNELISVKHRYNMLELLCKDFKNIEVSNIEIKLNKKIYATEIFEKLYMENKEKEIYFILGSDNLNSISSWKNFEEIIKKYKYIILGRPNYNSKEIINENKLLNENKDNFYIFNNTKYNVSSTIARENLDKNIITKEVMEYIIRNNLYKVGE